MRLRFAFLIFLAAISLAHAEKTASSSPNILVIIVDDLGYGDLACYGAKDLRTPRLDQFVRDGMRLDFFRANCSVCSPTRASLLTGCYPDRVGVPGVIRTDAENSWGHLAPNAMLLPQLLKKAGYHTAIVGKWHLGLESPNTPNERGFDFFHGFLGDMMDDYWTHLRHGNNYMRRNREVIQPKGHATDLFSEWASDYVRERSKSAKPFFLYLAYNAPHDPIQPPEEWLKKVRAREPEISDKRAQLVAFIEHLDGGIGRVFATLKETGLDENTLVMFTSDNGGSLSALANNGSLRHGKGGMYEGSLRVPFAARWPGKIKPGSRSDISAATMDLFPTALEAAGVKSRDDIDGVSLLPLLTGRVSSLPQREFYFVRREGGLPFGGKTSEALIRGDWKLLQNTPFTPLELYNLKTDPLETENLVEKNRQIVNDLNAALRKHIQRGGEVPWQKPNLIPANP